MLDGKYPTVSACVYAKPFAFAARSWELMLWTTQSSTAAPFLSRLFSRHRMSYLPPYHMADIWDSFRVLSLASRAATPRKRDTRSSDGSSSPSLNFCNQPSTHWNLKRTRRTEEYQCTERQKKARMGGSGWRTRREIRMAVSDGRKKSMESSSRAPNRAVLCRDYRCRIDRNDTLLAYI